MKTGVKKVGDTWVISLEGRLSFETQETVRDSLHKIVRRSKTDETAKKIIFDLKNLEFVGSSGISSFVQTLKEVNRDAPAKPRYCNVGSEFKKIIEAFDDDQAFEFFDNEERARSSFDN